MKPQSSLLIAITSAACVIGSALTCVVAAEQSRQVDLGPIEVVQRLQNVPFTVTLQTQLAARTEVDRTYLDAVVVGDYSDFQKKLSSIINALALPNNSCASYRPDNLVARLSKQELVTVGTGAQLSVDGNIDVWSCFENPVPNTSVEMIPDGPFGISRPKVVTSKGAPIKNRVLSQSFQLTLTVLASITDSNTPAIAIGEQSVKLDQREDLTTRSILNPALTDIAAQASKLLVTAFDANRQRRFVPLDYARLQPSSKSITFEGENNKLVMKLAMSAPVQIDQIDALFSRLARNKSFSVFPHFRLFDTTSADYAPTVRAILGAEGFTISDSTADSKVASVAPENGRNIEGGPHVSYFVDPVAAPQEQADIAKVAQEVADLLNENRPKGLGPFVPWRDSNNRQTHFLAVWF